MLDGVSLPNGPVSETEVVNDSVLNGFRRKGHLFKQGRRIQGWIAIFGVIIIITGFVGEGKAGCK